MNIALWVVQILLAFMFLYAGGIKVFAYEKYKAMISKHGDSGLSHSLTAFIGVSELAGALGLILPMASGVAPFLTPVAAAGLAVIMILATAYHLRRKEPFVTPLALLVLSLVVAVGRGISRA